MTQKQLVLNHLLSGRSLSSRKAISLFNCIRLSAIIFNLRHQGLDIISERKQSTINNGTYVSYYLKIN